MHAEFKKQLTPFSLIVIHTTPNVQHIWVRTDKKRFMG